MNYSNRKTEYKVKHILSSDWTIAKYILDDEDCIELLVEYNSLISFEKDDKILYSIESENSILSFNTVIDDIDFPTQDKITIRIKKPFERRHYSRYNVSLDSNISCTDGVESCCVVDVSVNGFKILTNLDLKLKNFIDLNINISDSEFIDSECLVVYKQLNTSYKQKYDFVYGVTIKHITPQNKRMLNDFILNLTN